ncbi:Alkylhydroperoxidase family enzyme, contains CxxC motif [Raineyella antarctica]|uniref:Alkylhydroperoxidase family enzyme, contains CxxC motif n=1 Tax=Raineyella antarctica TaxID=1577474 RepID=A0A1G6GD45_9ACTN|nr:carboxymuconolactone decarboxylase family protein [Raineyella antarctica]SDB79763.1 Alkylhydroperoxidase family enzyme, contains CxxC motif [Raineyella antarctica]
MSPVIPEPPGTNPLLWLGIRIAERVTGRRMVPARLLAWSPRTALGAGALEATAAHRIPGLNPRVLKIARITASLTANCAFCIDMNAHGHREVGLSDEDVYALRDGTEDGRTGFSPAEHLVIAYARGLSASPVAVDEDLLGRMAEAFDERQLVVLASTIASVHYWARFNQGLGVTPAGFGEHCLLPPAH